MANNLLTKAKKGETAIGIFLGDTDVCVAEIAAFAGFDYFRIDSEHSLVNPAKLGDVIRVANAYDIPMLVRISSLQEMKKLVDYGATGFLVPDVRTKNEAQEAVKCCKYHPVGQRGMSRSSRCCHYSAVSAGDYLKFADENVVLCVQIESREGLKNIDEILTVPGVDMVAVGRQDLAQDMGVIGQTNHHEVVAGENLVIEKGLLYNKFPLISATSPKQFEELRKRGVQLITVAYDTQFIYKAFHDHLEKFRAVAK